MTCTFALALPSASLFSLMQLFQNVSVLETLCFCRKNTLFLPLKQSVSWALIFWNTFSRGVITQPNSPGSGRDEPKGPLREKVVGEGKSHHSLKIGQEICRAVVSFTRKILVFCNTFRNFAASKTTLTLIYGRLFWNHQHSRLRKRLVLRHRLQLTSWHAPRRSCHLRPREGLYPQHPLAGTRLLPLEVRG